MLKNLGWLKGYVPVRKSEFCGCEVCVDRIIVSACGIPPHFEIFDLFTLLYNSNRKTTPEHDVEPVRSNPDYRNTVP
jgi:hypothetical protein